MTQEEKQVAPAASSTRADESGNPASGWRRRLRLDTWAVLGVLVGFSVFYYVLSYMRFTEFYGSNWDLGINMQALWTNTHGSLLYVTALSRSTPGGSFLLVHTTYVAIPISWLYSLAPTPPTLFALQAIVVASSAIPLYLVGERAQVPRLLLYAGIAIYLSSFPILSALMFDFHWEAFVSVEFLWTFYLLESGRYRLAFVPAILGIFTLEVFPFLVAGLGLYFVYPYIKELVATHSLSASSRRSLLLLVVLVVAALSLYAILTYIRENTIPQITGAPLILSTSGSSASALLGFGLRTGVTLNTLGDRLLYWFLLVSAFGLVPLFHRQRLLILSLPWFAYSVFITPNPDFTQFGFHYSFIAAPPLALGFMTGLGDLGAQLRGKVGSHIPLLGWPLLLLPILVSCVWYSTDLISGVTSGLWIGLVAACLIAILYLGIQIARRFSHLPRMIRARSIGGALTSRRALQVSSVTAIVVLVGLNFAMSPLNTSNAPPGLGDGYSFYYGQSPSFPYMSGLAAEIAPQGTVLASTNLFPFVANDANAYSLLWYHAVSKYLPFNATHLPTYVLLSSSQWFAVPNFLNAVLFNDSIYGVRTVLYSSDAYPGTIYLFELGFLGPTDVKQVTPFPTRSILCGTDFDVGASGVVESDPDSLCGSTVASSPAANLSGLGNVVWYGPYTTLLAGNYTVTMSVRGNLSGPGPANAPILVTNANATGVGLWYNVAIRANELSSTQWTNFTFHFQLKESHPRAEWRGYLSGERVNGEFIPGHIELNYIEVDYAPPAVPT